MVFSTPKVCLHCKKQLWTLATGQMVESAIPQLLESHHLLVLQHQVPSLQTQNLPKHKCHPALPEYSCC